MLSCEIYSLLEWELFFNFLTYTDLPGACSDVVIYGVVIDWFKYNIICVSAKSA